MNVKELIGKYEYLNHNYFRRVDTSEVLKDLRQLDEPEKPVVPQFVAEHIKYAKEHDWDLQDAMDFIEDDSELSSWFYTDDNMEIFARAWLDGYELEEKRYLVQIKGTGQYLEKTLPLINFSSLFKSTFTKKELEEAGFGWVFDCPGVEVEEVTE